MRALTRLLAAAILPLVAATALAAAPPASAAPAGPGPAAPLPVPHHFLEGALREITQPGAPLPGADDWNCRPDAAHPRPVILVHGTGGGATTNWITYGPLLHNEGYCVFSLTYGAFDDQPWPVSAVGGMRSIPDVSGPQVAAFVDRVLAATGAEQVDLIGHSQGTIVAGHVAKNLRPGSVGAVVSIAGLWEGTGERQAMESLDRAAPWVRPLLARIPAVESGPEMLANSAFVRELAADGGPYAAGVRYVNIATRYDEAVVPYTSGLLPGGPNVTNITVQDGCPEDLSDHVSIASSPRAADFVLNALDPDHPRTPWCGVVLPVHGPVGAVPR